jgi:hypothetical protein
MNMTAVQSAADTTTTTTFPLPVQRLDNRGRAMVMEVLKVMWNLSASVEVDSAISAWLTTSSSGTTNLTYANTRIIDALIRTKQLTTSGFIQTEEPVIHDLTDGAGHGVLVATDNIFIQVQSTATSAANTVNCKLLYRWKNVGDRAYIGIVQSQQ